MAVCFKIYIEQISAMYGHTEMCLVLNVSNASSINITGRYLPFHARKQKDCKKLKYITLCHYKKNKHREKS